MSLLNIENLKVFYGSINAIKGVSLQINEGDIVSLIGANGAGKTTLLNTITGVVEAESGSINYNDSDIFNERSDEILKMGVAHIPEGRKIFSELTVEENLMAGAYSLKDKIKVKELLERSYSLFPILADRRKQEGATLSGGEQQMLAIARGLMSDPDLVLLDEPSLGLAPIIIEGIFDLIIDIKKLGKTIFLVEQNASMALEIADYGYVLEIGRIVLEDTAENLRNNDEVRKAYLGVA